MFTYFRRRTLAGRRDFHRSSRSEPEQGRPRRNRSGWCDACGAAPGPLDDREFRFSVSTRREPNAPRCSPHPLQSPPMRPSHASVAIVTAALGLTACEAPKPKEHLELVEIETYWVIEKSAGQIQYLAPIARVVIKNRRSEPSPGIQATATFRRVDEVETWGFRLRTGGARINPSGRGRVGRDPPQIRRTLLLHGGAQIVLRA